VNHGIKQISISNPCTQNWADLEIVEHDRFCQSCQKTVTDFTKLTNGQIIEALCLSGNTCGRFSVGQLERVNAVLIPPQKTSSFSWKKFSIAAAFIGLVPFVKAQAQVKTPAHVVPVLNKSDTLSARQAGIERENISDELKKEPNSLPTINLDSEEPVIGVLGGVSVVSVEVSPDRTTSELIRQLFQFYFK